MALYVYGIIRAREVQRGMDAVEHGEVAALVKRLPDDQRTLRRDIILGHADVLQEAFEHGPVLPMRLGTAMPDPEAVARDLLAPRAELLARRLDALAGKAEMQVKAIYSEAPLLQSILDSNPALRQAVERSRRLPAAATHFEQIRIGEAIAGGVQARQTVDSAALLGALGPLALAVSVTAPHHERAVLNAAFLIDRDELGSFDAAVEQLSEQHAPSIEFKLIGPLPAYSFAENEWEAHTPSRSPA